MALWALPLLTQLKRVDLPTLGRPTIPHFKLILAVFSVSARGQETNIRLFSLSFCIQRKAYLRKQLIIEIYYYMEYEIDNLEEVVKDIDNKINYMDEYKEKLKQMYF